eukprot:GEMP01020899.1.p1 GENE.GEMP01020899.1~~GEMP01020899.1.p1  ORF type:complete len:462 (+),score=154.37 GEMP01020899.1:25-1410(+)
MVAGTIITESELRKIRDSLKTEEVSDEQARRIELQKKSKARADKWTNTLAGSRRKKAQIRLEELENQEKARKIIDEEEAKYQLEERKFVVNRANGMIFDDSDRVKSFRSRMMLSDVIAEREAQAELREELQKLELLRDERYLEMDRQNYRKMLERELTEKRDLEKRTKEQADAQAEQRAKKATKVAEAAEQLQREGMVIRQKAQEDLESEKKLEIQRRRQAKETSAISMRASEYTKEIQRTELLRARTEEKKIAEYAEKKERMLELRKNREQDIMATKMAAKQAMIDRQAKALAEMVSNEGARIQSQVEEADAAKERLRSAKDAELKHMEQDIDKSRKEQIKRKKLERDTELAEEQEIAMFLKEYSKKLTDEEDADKAQRRRELEALARDRLKQVAVRKRAEREAKRMEIKIATTAKLRCENENIEFHAFAEEVIKEYAMDGKNVIPILKNLQEHQKKGTE